MGWGPHADTTSGAGALRKGPRLRGIEELTSLPRRKAGGSRRNPEIRRHEKFVTAVFHRFRPPEALNGPRDRQKSTQDEKPAPGKLSGPPGTPPAGGSADLLRPLATSGGFAKSQAGGPSLKHCRVFLPSLPFTLRCVLPVLLLLFPSLLMRLGFLCVSPRQQCCRCSVDLACRRGSSCVRGSVDVASRAFTAQ